ncbi:MAG: hypothetical protein HWN66_19360 [Candidatus Helarchaeota archaeon]|nr:hypothetical protein [Candidatus Helarchaeota archaeon]
MVFGNLEWLVPVLALIGFAIGFLITWRRAKVAGVSEVIDTISMKYLDERRFQFKDIVKETKLPDPVVKRAMKELEKSEIIYRTSRTGWFALNDPLIFLSEKDRIRASRLTKDDNLVYGGYQHPFFSHVELLAVYGIFFGAIIFALVVGLVQPARDWLMVVLGLDPLVHYVDLTIFLLFIVLLGLLTTDAIENLISIWARERYSVVIGERSGIAYDNSYSDEYSGRIGRGRIRKVDLEISTAQKFLNYFMRVPIGDIHICCVAKEQGGPWIDFKNMPFPREMFFVIRSIQLKSLGWRKRHARTLMLWRARGAIPSIGF